MIQKIASLLLVTGLLAGCWSQQQLDSTTYIVAIGLDKVADNEVRVTYLIVNPEFGTQPEAPSEANPVSKISFLADDIFVAKYIANTLISKRISYTILAQLFVSADFAASDDFIRWIYDTTKETEIRKDIELVVTKESAYSFLKNFTPSVERKPYKYFQEKVEIGQESGLIPANSDLFHFFRITETDNDLFLSLYGSQERDLSVEPNPADFTYEKDRIKSKGDINQTQYLGAAVFKEGKMIGTLSGAETILTTLIQPNFRSGEDIFRRFTDPFDKNFQIATRMNMLKRTKIKFDASRSKPTIHVQMPVTVDVFTNHGMTQYYKEKDKQEILRKSIEKELNEDYRKLIKRTQEEFGSDPFGWSLIARQTFSTNEKFNQFNWMEKYPDMDIHFHADVSLRSFGRQNETGNLKKIRGGMKY